MPGKLSSARCSYRRRGDADTPRRRAQRHSTGSLTHFPVQPVVVGVATANHRSMRVATKLAFTELERFEEYGNEQWFAVWPR
jgi:RimJ/RimL family protein N-acetyltransferase